MTMRLFSGKLVKLLPQSIKAQIPTYVTIPSCSTLFPKNVLLLGEIYTACQDFQESHTVLQGFQEMATLYQGFQEKVASLSTSWRHPHCQQKACMHKATYKIMCIFLPGCAYRNCNKTHLAFLSNTANGRKDKKISVRILRIPCKYTFIWNSR